MDYRIRKDAGDLTLSDWQMCPVWEFCLDEECEADQTECTMRPSRVRPPVSWPKVDGGVACELVLAGGKRFAGVQWLCGQELDDESRSHVELWLDRPAQELCKERLPERFSSTLMASSSRLGFALGDPEYAPDAEVRQLIRLVYLVLGVSAAEMWPLEVRPRVAIRGWPKSWHVQGWMRSGGGVLR